MTKWRGTFFLPGGTVLCPEGRSGHTHLYAVNMHRGIPPKRQLYCIFQLMKKQNVVNKARKLTDEHLDSDH